MWEILECFFALDSANEGVRNNPTGVQILCMLGIVVVLIASFYMAFAQGKPIWLAGGAVAIVVLMLIITLAGRFDPT